MKIELEFIVAEISKSYVEGLEISKGLLCEKFENVIDVNLQRGYLLQSWQLNRVLDGTTLNETIIAVFRKMKR